MFNKPFKAFCKMKVTQTCKKQLFNKEAHSNTFTHFSLSMHKNNNLQTTIPTSQRFFSFIKQKTLFPTHLSNFNSKPTTNFNKFFSFTQQRKESTWETPDSAQHQKRKDFTTFHAKSHIRLTSLPSHVTPVLIKDSLRSIGLVTRVQLLKNHNNSPVVNISIYYLSTSKKLKVHFIKGICNSRVCVR